ncbi:MAG: 4Fe-4S dicluster domain-containing protein [Deltaproteobacteria bacterium]|nr:4Fe-4S dicluster domain-containing protein [Deltaproteobacteria bacterium]
MPRWGMVLDLKRCIGCNACTVACKMENSTPEGVLFTKTVSEVIGNYPNVTRAYIPLICNHCEEAPCERVCPTGATYTTDDGIVMVDENKCIGCGACHTGCPYKNRFKLHKEPFEKGLFKQGELTPFEKQGYPRFVIGTAVKCTFCHERVAEGLDPACVNTCPAEARIFGDLDDPNSKVRRLIQARKGYQPLPQFNTKPKVFYVE